MSELEIKITTDSSEVTRGSETEIPGFYLEMQKGMKNSYAQELDVDEFDPYCEHLIVRDGISREVVGTYRLMRGVQARTHTGSILSTIKSLDGELLELGRLCAGKDFRDRTLIPSMWRYEPSKY